jgi:hypothetical protein
MMSDSSPSVRYRDAQKNSNQDFCANKAKVTSWQVQNKEYTKNQYTSVSTVNNSTQIQYDLLKSYILLYARKCFDQLDVIADTSTEDEDLPSPNQASLRIARSFIEKLAVIQKLPKRISTTAEGGVCFVFSNSEERLYFEIYNDEEMGYISEDLSKKRIMRNHDVSTLDEMLGIINKL